MTYLCSVYRLYVLQDIIMYYQHNYDVICMTSFEYALAWPIVLSVGYCEGQKCIGTGSYEKYHNVIMMNQVTM